MADTSRTLAELQTLLADNSSGAISPQDLRDFLETYAETKMLKSAYGDYLFSGYALRGGASAPTFKVFRGSVYGYAFQGAGALQEAFFSIHLLHDLKVGTDLTFHVHWACNSAVPAGNVLIRLVSRILKVEIIQVMYHPLLFVQYSPAVLFCFPDLTSESQSFW